MTVTVNTRIIKCLLKVNQLDLIFEKATEQQIAILFDDIYEQIIKNKFCLKINNSKKILLAYILSKSKLSFENLFKILSKGTCYTEFGVEWIKNKKTDPPFELWPETPNIELQRAYKAFISVELPKEYTEKRFYDYMIKNKSKRNSECTAIYTLFSNNNEHKIIFIDDNNMLVPPAKKRMTIPIKYETIKTFIGEELDTNNITMLTKISGADFDKICGGNHLIDCFVYSDIKNIYRERTPLKQILEYFVNVLEIKYGIEVTFE